jgi:hypothetical protein
MSGSAVNRFLGCRDQRMPKYRHSAPAMFFFGAPNRECIYRPVLRLHARQLHAFLDGFWMVQPSTSAVWSVFACGQKIARGWSKKLHRLNEKNGILCAVGGENILCWNNTYTRWCVGWRNRVRSKFCFVKKMGCFVLCVTLFPLVIFPWT